MWPRPWPWTQFHDCRLATQPVWSRGARDSRLAIRSPRRHFAAGRHRRTVVHRRAPRSVQFPQAAEPFWKEATQVRPGQPVNVERTNRRPMGHVLPRRLSNVSGNQFVQKAFGEVLHPFRSMSEGSAFSRCSAHGADWHNRCAGPMPAQWKRPRRVFRCCPAARHARRSTSPPLPRWVGEPARCAPYADHAPSHRTAVSGWVSRHHSPTAATDPRGAAIPVTGTTVRSQSTCHEVQAGSFSTG